ncbi:MAG TPA: LysM peptidoglycan-binding domain-containing protein [Marmoricola sp.]|jgi:predicted Zn-dependent protease
MSTLSISPAFRPKTRPQLRLTRRGRVLLVLAFLLAAMVAMVVSGGFASAGREAGTPEPVRVVQVQPGDTLYGIAGELARPGHVRDMVHRIQQLNSMSGSSLQVGDSLAVPR